MYTYIISMFLKGKYLEVELEGIYICNEYA